MTRHGILWIFEPGNSDHPRRTALASDHIRLLTGPTINGDVVEMGPNEVKVDMSGVPKTFSVNQIDYIQFDDEPKDLTEARAKMRAGKLHEALALINRVKLGDVKRDDIKQDVEFYKAILMARLALAGGGSLKDAGKRLLDFEKARKNSYHYLEAVGGAGRSARGHRQGRQGRALLRPPGRHSLARISHPRRRADGPRTGSAEAIRQSHRKV